MPRWRAAGLGFGAVVTVLLVVTQMVTNQRSSDLPRMVARVNGNPITQSMVDEYLGVFTAPDGSVRVSRDTALLALINQALVEVEADRLAIAIEESEIDAGIRQWQELELTEASLTLSGGIEGLRDRIRLFLLFERIKRSVVEPIEVSDDDIVREYRRDYRYRPITLEDARQAIRETIVKRHSESEWKAWLAATRACASIEILDESYEIGPVESSIACP
jgi:hypothetical protein